MYVVLARVYSNKGREEDNVGCIKSSSLPSIATLEWCIGDITNRTSSSSGRISFRCYKASREHLCQPCCIMEGDAP